jgi:hypothetical protein
MTMAIDDLLTSKQAGRALIVAVALAMAWHTWGRWGDIQMDCGRELYVPMQILRGKLLYRDLFYAFGPLEPYLAALLLAIFGEHFYVFYLFGLILAIWSALLLCEIGAMLEGRAVGIAAAIAMLCQGFGSSIFNYVFPWSYAASLSMMLSLLCVWFVVRHILGEGRHNMMLAGLFAGLALLGKQEFGIACYVVLAFVPAWETVFEHGSARALFRSIGACGPGLVLALALYGWLFYVLTPRFLIADNWVEVPGTYWMRTYGAHWAALVGLRFDPIELACLIVGAVLALRLWFLIAKAKQRVGNGWFVASVTTLGLVIIASRRFAPAARDWGMACLIFPTGMFFVGCGLVAYTLYELRKTGARHLLGEAAVGVFALVLALRVFARVSPYGYSIFYDGPLILLFMMALRKCIAAAAASNLAAEPLRELIGSLLAVEVFLLAVAVIPGDSRRTAALETRWGAIYLQPDETLVAKQIIDFVTEQSRKHRRVALLPELPMIYALTEAEAPSRWYTIIPGAPSPSEEASYIIDIERNNPEYIILSNRYTGEYGPAYFGIDYDQRILRWVEAKYCVVGQFGRFRRDGSRFLTALLYQRRTLEKCHIDERVSRSSN